MTNEYDTQMSDLYDREEDIIEEEDDEQETETITESDLEKVEPYLEEKSKESDGLQTYLNQIKAYPLLTAEEEHELALRVRDGDEEAREKMINSNLRFVVAKAIKFSGKGVEITDLIQEGNFGLIKAVDKFDPDKGTRLSTYAGFWVRQALELAVADISRSSSVPKKTISRFKTSVKRVYQNSPGMEDYPTAGMIAEEMGTKKENVESIFRAIQEPVQLDAPVKQGEDTKYYEVIEDFTSESAIEALERSETRKIVNECLDQLPRKSRLVVKMMTGYADGVEHSADEIGKELHVTRERVRQIAEDAFRAFQEIAPSFIKNEYATQKN